MSGDSKIGMQVGGTVRTGAVRTSAVGSAGTARQASATSPVGEAMPATQLLALTRTLADQAPPIDGERVARLRSAIASGDYRIDAAALAHAMIGFHRGSAGAC